MNKAPAVMHPRLDSAIDLLESLIGFDTQSGNGNLALIDFIQDYLSQWGIQGTLSGDIEGGKANLYATIGPSDRPGLCLSGHTDVVPVRGQPWTVEPFRLTRQQGRLLGRGTADMKGYLAAMLASVPVFVSTCERLPIHLAFTYDEEVGCLGVPHLLAQLNHTGVKPLACIIGEPTSMQVAVAHKGKRAYRCCVHGLAGHSALTHMGVNAVDFAAELAVRLRRIGQRLRQQGPYDARFEPPYSTVHTGRLNGGIALNVIPDHAQLEFEIRNLPQDDVGVLLEEVRQFIDTELLPEMRAGYSDSAIELEESEVYPELRDENASGWLQALACQATEHTDRVTLSFGTEGGLFQQVGIPTIVCGPGSIQQAHKADEYLEVSQLAQCLGFLERLAAAFPAAAASRS